MSGPGSGTGPAHGSAHGSAYGPALVDTTLDVAFGGASLRGAHAPNQDAYAAFAGTDARQRRFKGASLAIADGVGCSDRSQEASRMAVTEFLHGYHATDATLSTRDSASVVLGALNGWLCAQNRNGAADADGNSLVTTLTAVVIKGERAHVFHAGDSRAWLVRDGKLRRLTDDHVRRYDGRPVLVRGLGIEPHLQVEHREETLRPGDLIALTTDGVHGPVGADELQSLLAHDDAGMQEKAADGRAALERLAGAVVGRARAAGGEDDATCVCARVRRLGSETPEQAWHRLTRRAVPPVLERGQRIDGYEVVRVLHASARSHLYLVAPDAGGPFLVLKAPSRNFAEDLVHLDGFALEQWVTLQIDHPGILKGVPTPPGSPFLYALFEHVEGQTLRQWIVDHPSPSLTRVRELLDQLVDALRALHRKGIVHRDIKPENVMIDERGRVKLIDLGTVRVDGHAELASGVEAGPPVGSANYIAPEYRLGGPASVQSDLFSLGCTVQEMLTGELPYTMDDAHASAPGGLAAWTRVRRAARVARPDLPDWIDHALEKATAPDPARRYAAYSEFVHDMRVPNRAALGRRAGRSLAERHPVRFWQTVSALLLLALIVSLATLTGVR